MYLIHLSIKGYLVVPFSYIEPHWFCSFLNLRHDLVCRALRSKTGFSLCNSLKNEKLQSRELMASKESHLTNLRCTYPSRNGISSGQFLQYYHFIRKIWHLTLEFKMKMYLVQIQQPKKSIFNLVCALLLIHVISIHKPYRTIIVLLYKYLLLLK